MVLHEFATNAAKYRPPSASGGAIRLSWRVVRYGAGPKLKPAWQESGGPPVETPAPRSRHPPGRAWRPISLRAMPVNLFLDQGMLRFPRVR
jgi:hypothetical protein